MLSLELPSLLPTFLNKKYVSSFLELPIGSSNPSHHLLTSSPGFAALHLRLRFVLTSHHLRSLHPVFCCLFIFGSAIVLTSVILSRVHFRVNNIANQSLYYQSEFMF
ncbi:unnamed protein product [Camellia sinensis]